MRDGVRIDACFGARPYRIVGERASCSPAADWYWSFRHRAESERGLDDLEDLFRPALFSMTLGAGEAGAVVMSAEAVSCSPRMKASRASAPGSRNCSIVRPPSASRSTAR